ncbi:MAG: MFS transporter [Solirubrobacterales bacterium]
MALYKIDATIVTVALPTIQKDFDTSAAALAWIVSAYLLALASVIPLAGALGDRFGRRKMFVLGLALFSMGSIGCALSPSESVLVGFRVVQGCAAGLIVPISMSIIGATFRVGDMPTAYGLWSGISSIGFVIGPLAGGLLVEEVGWSSIFWVNVPLALALIPTTFLLVEETKDTTSRPIDFPGIALAMGGIFSLSFALIGSTSRGWEATGTVLPLVGGIFLRALFVAWEFRTPNPVLPMDFFRQPGFALGGSIGAIVYVFPALMLLLVLYFQGILGESPAVAGLLFLPLAAALTIVAILAGPITKRLGALPSMALGMALLGAGALGLGLLPVSGSLPLLVGSEVLVGVGIMLAIPAASAIMMGAVPRERAGIASAVMQTFRQGGAVLFIALLSAIAAAEASSSFGLEAGASGRLRHEVVGAQISLINQQSGARVADLAESAWTSGMHLAMHFVAGLALLGMVLCLVTIGRRYRADHSHPVTSSH